MKGAVPMNTVSMRKQEEQWRTESDLEALIRAEEIRKDKKRLARVRKLAKEKMQATTKAMQLATK
jgi:hypothetical protein